MVSGAWRWSMNVAPHSLAFLGRDNLPRWTGWRNAWAGDHRLQRAMGHGASSWPHQIRKLHS